MPCNLDRQRIGDFLSSFFFVFHPHHVRQRDPNRTAANQEFDVNGVGMAGGNRNNQRLVLAVDLLL